jgi:hypothetical protein
VRRLLALGVLLAAGCQSHAAVPVPPAASLAPDAVSGEDFARAACVQLRLAEQGITADSPAATVRRELAEARELAGAAAARDPAYSALSGGAAALDDAVLRDDPSAADVAVRVVRANCKST